MSRLPAGLPWLAARMPPGCTLLPVAFPIARRGKYSAGKLRQKKANVAIRKKESQRVSEWKQLERTKEQLEKADRPAPAAPVLPALGISAARKLPPELRLEWEDLKEFGPMPGSGQRPAFGPGSSSAASPAARKPEKVSIFADSVVQTIAPSFGRPERSVDEEVLTDAGKRVLSLRVAFADFPEGGLEEAASYFGDKRGDAKSAMTAIIIDSDAEQAQAEPTLFNVNAVIYANAVTGRLENAKEAFSLIEDLGFKPNTRSYNGLILAHVKAKDLRGAVDAFKALEGSHCEPTIHSFGMLIKGCADAGQLRSAYGLYEELKARGLTPNLHVFTTLVAACIDQGDLDRAQRTFDHARNELNIVPDRDLYTTMFSLAARQNNAERALDLYEEMQERGILPSADSFNAAIAACARRPDFHKDAFKLFARMMADDMKPTVVTYDVLMTACATAGDLLGARDLWNAAVETSSPGHVEVDARLATSFMRVYAHALGDWFLHLKTESKTAGKKLRRFIREVGQNGSLEQPVHKVLPFGEWLERRRLAVKAEIGDPTLGEEAPKWASFHEVAVPYEDAAKPVIVSDAWDPADGDPPLYEPSDTLPPSAVFLTFPEGCEDTALVFPTLQQDLQTEDHLIAEARALFNWIARRNGRLLLLPDGERQGELLLTEPLLDEYLKLHSRHPIMGLALPETADLLASLLPDKDWDAGARFQVFDKVTRDPRLMDRHATRLWTELLAWDAARESQLEPTALSPAEREQRREKEGRGKKTWHHAFVSLANGRARCGDWRGAFAAITELHNFRHPFYLPAPDPKQLSPVFTLCYDMAEDGDSDPLRQLRRMVPDVADSPLEEVQRVLRRKWVGSEWWGWEAMGVGKKKVLEWESKMRKEVKEIRTRGLGDDRKRTIMARLEGGDEAKRIGSR